MSCWPMMNLLSGRRVGAEVFLSRSATSGAGARDRSGVPRRCSWSLLLILLLGLTRAGAATFVSFETNATWRYVKGTSEASLPDTTAWRQRGFADAAWATGAAPFFYGETYLSPGTVLDDMQNRYTTLFLRRPFVITNATEVAELELTAACDDGFIAWINGVPVVNFNGPAEAPATNSVATAVALEPPPFQGYPLLSPQDFLVPGTNVLAIQVFNVSPGSSDLVFDAGLTITLDEPSDPRVLVVNPEPGAALTTLTQLTVTFNEPVTGVDAGDLRVNDIPCTEMAGSGTTYTFTFAPPAYGVVQVSWDMRCGITDLGSPPVAFDPTGPGARWIYDFFDPSAPTVASLNPPAQATVRQLRQIEVAFNMPVEGVDAADLVINGVPATNVIGVAAGPYVFEFPAVAAGPVQAQWAQGHGIVAVAPAASAFDGEPWSLTVNPQLIQPDVIINEFMAENVSGLADEDADREDWIELYNRGDTTVNLQGWSLTDDPRLPGEWVFPAVSLPAKRYLVVFASGKDRRPAGGNARLHTNFKLGIAGEYLGLYNAESPRVAVSELAPEYPAQRNDVAFGRDPLETWRYYVTPTPGVANTGATIGAVVEPVHFSAARGFFARPFNLSLATPTPGAEIRYTLDGSVPTPTNGIVYTNLILINTTRIVRAAAFRGASLPSPVVTHTYLYNQAANRRLLPALSLVTASNHLYGKSGIMEYSPRNTYNHGIAWERPVSAEWIQPEDNGGFQVDCGLRIQGGGYIRGIYNYRSGNIPESKYSFRLYFRGDYGAGRLRYPIFPEVPLESFDTIVLRAGMNDPTNPFLRDEFARRLEADVGQVAARGTFVNLFLNGVYKGYYNPTERIDVDFLRAWHGSTNDWDLIAMSGEIREGDAVAWNALRNYANANNLALADRYAEIERRLDLSNFVEYLIPHIYGDTDDWPHNNWRAARERVAGARYRFYAWDAEWSFGYNGTVSHNTIAGQLSNLSPPWGATEIQQLFLRLKASPEFRLLFADRVHKHFFNGGAMTDDRLKARYDWLKAMIAPSIPGYNDTIGTSWIPNRRRYLTNHFNLTGLLASSNAPVLSRFGGAVPSGFPLTLSNGVGTIYFTTNGADPRVRFTGAVAPDAQAYLPGTPLVLTHTLSLRARTQWGTNWSAVTEATFQLDESGQPLRITEIMYHPPGGEEYEFIELENASGVAVDLSGVHLEGVEFTFREGTLLAGGARLVLIPDANPAAFAKRYPGVPVFGWYAGNLSNRGERLALVDAANRVLVSVDYRDADGWPAGADGAGGSLELIDPAGDPDSPANWQARPQAGGSPGAANPPLPSRPIQLNELSTATPPGSPGTTLTTDWCELYNPGSVALDLAGWVLSDGGAGRRFVFPPAILAAGQYLVVHCDTNASPAGLHAGFTLGRDGDRLFLENASGERVDALEFGPQVAGYSLGRVGAESAWSLTEPTPGAVNAAVPLGSSATLVINEFLPNAVPGGDDWIELYNRDRELPVALRGLTLTATNASFTMTSLAFIAPGGHVLLHADEQPGPDHVDFKLPASRGFLALFDAEGMLIDRAGYTNAVEGVSYGRLPDGHTNLVTFSLSASPGTTNYVLDYRGVVLNEALARNVSATTNAAGRCADWVELFNPGAAAIELNGMSLSVDERQPGQWLFPPGLVLGPQQYLVVWCDPLRPASLMVEPELNCGQALADSGGGVHLFNAAGQLVDSVEYGFQLPDRAFGRVGSGWQLMQQPTPGRTNALPAGLGNPLNLRLNEWMAHADQPDWIELYNLDELPLNLAGLALTDDPSLAGQTNHVIGHLTFIAGHGRVVWTADGDTRRGPDHLGFSLDALGETLRIYTANFTVIDSVDLLAQLPGVAEGRFPDGASNVVRFPTTASPGTANHLALDDVVINEILASASPPFESAIEFHNASRAPRDLSGWWLGTDADSLNEFQIPPGTVVPARGYAVLYQNQLQPTAPGGAGLQFDAARGGEVILSEVESSGAATGYRSIFRYGVAAANTPWGRIETSLGGDFAPLVRPSFGVGWPATVAEFRSGRGAPNAPPQVGPIVINEIMYSPMARAAEGMVEQPDAEFLELHNTTTEPVPLFDPLLPANRWRVGGGIEFTLPEGTTLPSGGYLVLVGFDPAANPAALAAFRGLYQLDPGAQLLGPYRGRLANEGERVVLERPLTPLPGPGADAGYVPYALVDRVDYSPDLPWPPAARDTGRALSRHAPWAFGNEPRNWLAGWPTPGRDNLWTDPDADRDTLPDDWEWAHSLDPYVGTGPDGPDGDPDNDGVPNRLEYLLGSDPGGKDLILTGITVASDGVHLSFNAIAGRSYTVEDRDDPAGGAWRLVTNILPSPTSRIIALKFPPSPGAATRYYRVRLN